MRRFLLWLPIALALMLSGCSLTDDKPKLSKELADRDLEVKRLFEIAVALEGEVISTLGAEKSIFPNVDYWSGLTFAALGVPEYLFAPIFAVSRVAGWTSRVLEYLNHNRIFRPRAIYVGEFGRSVVPIEERG